MNPITALAVANSINQDRLEAAARRRQSTPLAKHERSPRPSHLMDMMRAYLVGFRAKAQPTR
jgi:hypothetical protein